MQALNLRPAAWSYYAPCRILPGVVGPFFKEWRKKRGYTLEELAFALGEYNDPNIIATAASLSRLENGKQPYNQYTLEALARIYDIEVHELIGTNPQIRDEIDRAVSSLHKMDEVSRRRTLKMIQAMEQALAEEAGESEAAEAPPQPPAKAPPRKKKVS